MHQQHKNTTDIYAMVTDKIIEHLEKGTVPWHKPWTGGEAPQNLVTGKPYHGINALLLNSLGYERNSFLTFRQARELGATIRKGEKAAPVIFWKWLERENKETKEKEKIPLLRYYSVFNVSQCDGIPNEKLPAVVERTPDQIPACEEIIAKMPNRPEIRHVEQRAYYSPALDYVNMPRLETFDDNAAYYGTLFHELVHASGHESRLNRKELMDETRFGSEQYSIEELTAEIGASFLKAQASIPIERVENSAAYIQGWLKVLRNDKRFIVHASAQAQKAADFILNVREQELKIEMSQDEFPLQRGEELRHLRPACRITRAKVR